MSLHPYEDLAFGVQALRQLVDRDACALGGALGVAARHLPHQIGNVWRVLGDLEVRHLLADEVGLGKTIQALMIINALQLQRTARGDEAQLRVLIVVPNELMSQWRSECLSRGHIAAIDGAVKLAWPKILSGSSEIDPERYDMLIVDEFHSLKRSLQQKIMRTAPQFMQLLLISATPPFQDPQKLGELLQMLEPDRAATVSEPEDAESVLPEKLLIAEGGAADALAMEDGGGMFWSALGGEPPEHDRAASVSLAHCSMRRIVRTRRSNFSEYMPPRQHRAITIEPVEAEVTRQELMWQYFSYLDDMSRVFDLNLLAQRVIRSLASLRQRVTYLRGHEYEREGLLEQVSPLLSADNGESRLDALCDLLSELWLREPDAKILVAAGDNLTVDDLTKRLPRLLGEAGPLDAPVEVKVASVRNQPKDIAQEVTDQDEVQREVSAFTEGDANLLIAADIAKQGLNLQKTRHIVLYSIPWDPQEIEQWIGRVDRIGNTAVKVPGERELLPIVAYTISQRGLVDERIVEVMKATAVLERSISLDSEAVQAVKRSIEVAALEGAGGGWRDLLSDAKRLSGGNIEDLDAPLLPQLPWTAASSKALFEELDNRLLPPPICGSADTSGLSGREHATLGWLLAMERAEEYDYRPGRAKTDGLHSLGYQVLDRPDARGRESKAIVKSRVYLNPSRITYPKRPVYFHVRRDDLRQPPQQAYIWRDEHNPVYFMDHGSPLLDDLVTGWLKQGRESDPHFQLLLPREHPAYEALCGKTISLVVGDLDPAASLGDLGMILAGVSSRTGAPDIALLSADRRLGAARYADERFVRLHLPRQICCAGEALSRSGSAPLSEDDLWKLLDPAAGGRRAPLARSGYYNKTPRWLDKASSESEARLLQQATKNGQQRWSSTLPRLRTALEQRLYLLSVEEHYAVEGNLKEASMAHARAEARRRWLRAVPDSLQDVEVSLYRRALIEIHGLAR